MEPMFKIQGKWPGLMEEGTLDLLRRPAVPNPEGGTSSIFSMSVGMDGKEYLIPRVSEDGKLMSENEAVDYFKKTGGHLGVFDSPKSATEYAKKLHLQQEQLAFSRELSMLLGMKMP